MNHDRLKDGINHGLHDEFRGLAVYQQRSNFMSVSLNTIPDMDHGIERDKHAQERLIAYRKAPLSGFSMQLKLVLHHKILQQGGQSYRLCQWLTNICWIVILHFDTTDKADKIDS